MAVHGTRGHISWPETAYSRFYMHHELAIPRGRVILDEALPSGIAFVRADSCTLAYQQQHGSQNNRVLDAVLVGQILMRQRKGQA